MTISNWTKLNRIRLSSFFGAFIWKIGSACCPCFGRSVSAEESSWQAIARQFVKRMTTTTTPSAATEGQQLIKRTKSEEEILKKRPKRKVAAKKNNENDSVLFFSTVVNSKMQYVGILFIFGIKSFALK